MSDDLLARAQRLWTVLAGVPSTAYPGAPVTVEVAPGSGLCPPGWAGVVRLGDTALLTAPTEAVAEQLRRAAAVLTAAALADPLRLGALAPPREVLGPARLGYLSAELFRPVTGPARAVVALPAGHRAIQELLARAGQEDRDECGLADVTSPVFTVVDGERADGAPVAVAACGYRSWPGGAAHLCVLTDPAHRSRGLARQVASAAVTHALEAGLLPQWRARPAASRRVARALGFRELGEQLSLRY
ncbi:hypothetical protein GCM10009665_78460 [Kitasatospora nipponensis]|uniref:N-acetyltransferase domain-containing protein n=1 Tax=Kitasatospora nipponensis TaxID=258049 RepID=A0ABN1TA24_9ACTN